MLQHGQKLEFFLRDEVEGRPLTPQNVDLLTLHQFMGEVIGLIQGEAKKSDLGAPSVALEPGSVKLVSIVGAVVAASFHADMRTLDRTADLDSISSKRAQVIETWQNRSRKAGSMRRYDVVCQTGERDEVRLHVGQKSDFRHLQRDRWTRAEKSLVGRVVDLGGKTRPNVHLVLASGESVMIDATETQLAGADYLYRNVMLQVEAMEHVVDGRLREVRLLDVVRPAREIDESKLARLWEKGREAWSQVTNPTEWVERLRES